MNNQDLSVEKILRKLKNGELHLERNSAGSMYIRDKQFCDFKDEIKMPRYCKPQQFLSKILHSEMRLVRKNILIWLTEIEKNCHINQLENIENFAVAMNQFALILLYVNQSATALQFCKNLILLYNDLAQYGVDPSYMIQPYVNIIRIFRIEGDYENMNNYLYNLVNESQLNNNVLQEKINIARNKRPQFQELVKYTSIIEPIKGLLAQQQYAEIINLFSDEIHQVITTERKINEMLVSYKAEALIIAYHALGQVRQAYKIAKFFFQQGIISEMTLFSYRLTELYLSAGLQSNYLAECSRLAGFLERCLTKQKFELSEIIFAFNVSNIFRNNQLRYELLKKICQAFKILGEEQGMIECLKKLVFEYHDTDSEIEYANWITQTGYAMLNPVRSVPIIITEKINMLTDRINILLQQYRNEK